jgi:hypothetical protein
VKDNGHFNIARYAVGESPMVEVKSRIRWAPQLRCGQVAAEPHAPQHPLGVKDSLRVLARLWHAAGLLSGSGR